jgi:uncharacterized protein (TIGR02421 family)
MQVRYAETIRTLSEQILLAQGPIRTLDSLKWPPHVAKELLESNFKKMPTMGKTEYEKIKLTFDLKKVMAQFQDIIGNIKRELGSDDRVGILLQEICTEYQHVLEMISFRGTKEFGVWSKRLYGSSFDTFHDDSCTVNELGQTLKEILSGVDCYPLGPEDPKVIPAEEVVATLKKRFDAYFIHHDVGVQLSDGLISDAAAGGDKIRINQDILFSQRDIDILEVHEGIVHIGSTFNGANQPYAKWLSKGPPRVVCAQEGLAVMMEIFTFRSDFIRTRRINDRVVGINLVEQGANLLELCEYYLNQGYYPDAVLYNVRRIFRGAPLEGGSPFTKDLSYAKGFVENYNFIRSAIAAGCPQLIPFLFIGKINLQDIPLLYELQLEGIVEPPLYLPPQFTDMNGLAVWMSYSNFFNKLNLKGIKKTFAKLFSQVDIAPCPLPDRWKGK